MNIITKEEARKHDAVDLLADFEIDLIQNDYRKGSSFYRTIVIEITEKDCKEYELPVEWEGLWKSDSYTWDEKYWDYEDCYPYIRVLKVEKEITTVVTTYEEIK